MEKKNNIDKNEELKNWREHLVELTPKVIEQIEWLEKGKVSASKKVDCPKELEKVAEHLVEIQNKNGEYQRNLISKTDVESIKYYAKKKGLSFDDVISLAVENSRYVGKSAIEAKGIVGFVMEINSVYNKYYDKFGVFPINAMSAESKRACRNFDSNVSLTEKIQTIISVYLPELEGIKIVEKDFSVLPQSRFELSEKDIKEICNYFQKNAVNGSIDNCFSSHNQEKFIEVCRLLARANLSLDEFLEKYTDLSYTKCYSGDIVATVKQMILSYKNRHGTTRQITDNDSYLRNKIDVAQKYTMKHSMLELVKFLGIDGDNSNDGRKALSENELKARQDVLFKKLERLYPNKIIDKSFIKSQPELYEEVKLLVGRFGYDSINDYLAVNGFTRQSSHERVVETVFYLSTRDLYNYNFNELSEQELDKCKLKLLDPAQFFGVYNKLIYSNLDSSSVFKDKGQPGGNE